MKNTPAAAGTGEAAITQERPRARVPHITDPADASPMRAGDGWFDVSNDGDLTAEDLDEIDAEFSQPDATTRAMDCLKRGFSDSLSQQREELTPEDVDAEVRRIEADLHINQMKSSGEYDQRRLDRGQGL